MEFNPTTSKHGVERFVLLKDVHQFVRNDKIKIDIKIQANGISKASNSVKLTKLSADERELKLQVTFRDIVFGTISPEFEHHNTRFNICVLKRPVFVRERPKQALWFYFCRRNEIDEQLKWEYAFSMLSSNENIKPLTQRYEDIQFSKSKNSSGAPFIHLDELYDDKNGFLSANGAITFKFTLRVIENVQPSGDQIDGLRQMNIKSLPQSPLSPPKTDRRSREIAPARSLPSSYDMNGNISQSSEVNPEPNATLTCVYCSRNLFDDRVYGAKCGHLYCKECFWNDIAIRKMCIKCDTHFRKDQCGRVHLNEEHQKYCRQKDDGASVEPLIRSQFHLHCPLCDRDLRTADTYATSCGHLYCRNCLNSDIAKRKMCIVCNRNDLGFRWIQIFFS